MAFAQLRDFLFTFMSRLFAAKLQQDRLAKLLYEYELRGREHGFKPVAAACDVLLNSQNLIKLAGAGILGAVTGGMAGIPLAATAAGASGAALVFDCARAAIASKRALLERVGRVGNPPSQLGLHGACELSSLMCSTR